MILNFEDWNRYPHALVHTKTKNQSFINMAYIFKKMGLKNHAFLLALHNPLLENVNPHDKNLSKEIMGYIAEEVEINPWYYLRECVRVPVKSGVDIVRFEANRGNIALFWLFFNNIPLLLIQPRQTGKTFSTATLFRGLLNFWILNTQINLLTKDIKLRTDTVELMKDIENHLPKFLQMTTRKDMDNKEGVTVRANKNVYKTQIGQSSLPAALNAARGLTSSIFHIDEFGYIYNIEHMLAPALAAGGKARDNAKKANMPYGTIFTTTSARQDLPSGRYAYSVYLTGAEFTELLYDIGNKDRLKNYVRKHTLKGNPPLMVCEFNHRQLGYTDEWLVTTMEESRSMGQDSEADFLNKWPEGGASSPLDGKYLTFIADSEKEIKYLGITGEGFAIRWYVSENMVKNELPNRELVLGLDTSDAIGKDDIALVIRDVQTGEVYGAGQYNNLNTIHFGEWVAEILIMLPRSVLIIERRSTGTSIIDTIILKLLEKNIDPYKRLFNWVVNDEDVNPSKFNTIKLPMGRRASNIYDIHRRDIGFATSGNGRTARSRLYGETLLDSVKFTGGVVNDKRLIKQIQGLKEKDGRVDHHANEHDDLVIAWLLTYWFLAKAKNVSFYGLEPNHLLSNVINNSTTVEEDLKIDKYKNKQLRIKAELNSLIERLAVTENPIVLNKIITRVRMLDRSLDKKIISGVNIEAAIDEVFKSKKKQKNKSYNIPKFR